MAREFGRIRISIADDADFEDLAPEGQWLYTRIGIPETSLNHCGVFDWRPARLIRKARGLTIAYLERAAADCEHGRFVLFDIDTEEALMRSYIRSEELLRNPKMAVAVINAYRATASKILRAAVVDELRRIKDEHPEYSSWKAGDVGAQLAELLTRPGSDQVPYVVRYAHRIGNGESVGIGNADPVPISNPEMVPNTDRQTNRSPTGSPNRNGADSLQTAPTDLRLQTREGYVSPVGHQSDDPDSNIPPPRYCPDHMPDGDSDGKACRACGAHGRALIDWTKRRTEDEHRARRDALEQAAADRAAEIAACNLCNPDGYRAGVVCDHIDRTEISATGAAMVREALALSRTAPTPETAGDGE